MKLNELKSNLDRLNSDIKRILKSSGYEDYAELTVDYDSDNPDELMLHTELSGVMSRLDEITRALNYLNSPIKREGVLCKNGNGRYEIGDYELTSGSPVEVLIYDDRWEWVSSRIEHDGRDYYLVGARDVDLNGLRGRIR